MALYKAIFFLVAMLFILEISTSLWLQYIFNLDINSLNINIIDSIFFSYPTIIMLYFCVYLSYLYINTHKITILKIWNHDKTFKVITYVQGILTLMISIILYWFFVRNNLINTLDKTIVFRISLMFYTLLILHIIIPWIVVSKRGIR